MTGDGSHSLFVHSMDEHYHSTFGALKESEHVFIRAGLHAASAGRKSLAALEVGFGTGLNALLTCLEAERLRTAVRYLGLEPHPLEESVWSRLNYPELLRQRHARDLFEAMHRSPFEKWHSLTGLFSFFKTRSALQNYQGSGMLFDLVYFDAFGPQAQPEMWTPDIFQKLAGMMAEGGIMVTYSSKGTVKRAMKAAGLAVEKLPGPPGKREFLRAIKLK
jgi:tRNA U34 5-methylaminomethyl-2-thiouridine-forming methyltransferase MnmC